MKKIFWILGIFFACTARFSKIKYTFFAFHPKCAEIHRKVPKLVTISRFFSFTKIHANTHRIKKMSKKYFSCCPLIMSED